MSHSPNSGKILHSLIFSFILIISGLLFFILPKDKISESEKRTLTPLPQFSIASLRSGTLMDSLDLYYSDNFIFRNTLISTANQIKENFGIKNEETRI